VLAFPVLLSLLSSMFEDIFIDNFKLLIIPLKGSSIHNQYC
jgi:hypothetical protein